MQKKIPSINKEKLKQIWTKLNETNVDEIIPYIKRNKKQVLIATGGLLALILLIVLIKINLGFFAKDQIDDQTNSTALPPKTVNKDAPSSTFLPETKRNLDSKGTGSPGRDPFNGTIKLKGIMAGGGGDSLAILEMANTAYIAGPGTELPGGMVVKAVTKTQVVLESVEGKLYLEFDGRSTIEKPAAKSTENTTKTVEKDSTAKNEGGGG